PARLSSAPEALSRGHGAGRVLLAAYGKKEMAARLAAAARIPHALRVLPSRNRHVTILAYHRIYDMGDEEGFPFDPELVSATPADFAAQVQWVKRWGTPMTFRRLGEALDSGRIPPRPV